MAAIAGVILSIIISILPCVPDLVAVVTLPRNKKNHVDTVVVKGFAYKFFVNKSDFYTT